MDWIGGNVWGIVFLALVFGVCAAIIKSDYKHFSESPPEDNTDI